MDLLVFSNETNKIEETLSTCGNDPDGDACLKMEEEVGQFWCALLDKGEAAVTENLTLRGNVSVKNYPDEGFTQFELVDKSSGGYNLPVYCD